MTIYNRHTEFYSQPIRLTDKQMKEPVKVLSDFFADFHLYESRENLATWLECALTTHNPQFAEAAQRNTLVSFAGRLEELIEAAYILSKKKKP